MPVCSVITILAGQKQKVFGKKQERVTAIIEEEYSELKGKFECKRCSRKISSNFALLLSLYFIPPEDGVLCPDCLKKYIYELEKPEKEK